MMADRIPVPIDEVSLKRAIDNGCVPAWKLQALINVLIAKGIITAKDLEADSARSS